MTSAARFVRWPTELDGETAAGGKARSLARLTGAGLPVPPWFVVVSDALAASVAGGASVIRGPGDPATPTEATLATLVPAPQVDDELAMALSRLCPHGERVAVRSSALEEDSATLSFAGQLESYVFVDPPDVARRVADVWRSGFSDRILDYRRRAGLHTPPTPPAVIVQRAVDGRVSGVAFSADPVSGRRGVAVVSAVPGPGAPLVAGEADADTWHVDRAGRIVAEHVSPARRASGPPAAVRTGGRETDNRAPPPALSPAEVTAVAALARRAERLFGCPQDIEWSIEGQQLLLLQSRPITTLAGTADPDGARALWDNANISENYSGVTTPLTFSFARGLYETAFRAFCRHMGVSARIVARHASDFRGMIGLIRGRMYYNLVAWYRILSLLPGFAANRAFLEQMLGVPESGAGLIPPLPRRRGARGRGLETLRRLRVVWAIAANSPWMHRSVARFLARLDATFGGAADDPGDLRPDELAQLYRALEYRLGVGAWVPPLNDFYVMVFYGLLRRCTRRWIDPAARPLLNALLSGERDSVATELTTRIRRLARLAAPDAGLVRTLCEGSAPEIQEALHAAAPLQGEYRRYLEAFGERCVDELKLESRPLDEDPLPLLRAVGRLAQRSGPDAPPLEDEVFAARAEAERRVRAALGRRPWRRATFRWLLASTRARLRDREALRFARTRIFGRARRILLELGRRLVAVGALDAPRDVLYLDVEEVLGFVEGRACTTDLRGLVAVRRREFAAFEADQAPPDRFETRGIAYVGDQWSAPRRPPAPALETRQGIGCCPGIVRGPVTLVGDPRRIEGRPGAIIVAERTDPGWTVILPAARGLLVERGNVLSHAAIVAREIGLPTVVALPGLMDWLQDGDEVELDGGSGRVVKVRPVSASGDRDGE